MKRLILASILGLTLSQGYVLADHCNCDKCKDKKEHCDKDSGKCEGCKGCKHDGGKCGDKH